MTLFFLFRSRCEWCEFTTIRLNCFTIHLRSVTHKKILLAFAEGRDDQQINQTMDEGSGNLDTREIKKEIVENLDEVDETGDHLKQTDKQISMDNSINLTDENLGSEQNGVANNTGNPDEEMLIVSENNSFDQTDNTPQSDMENMDATTENDSDDMAKGNDSENLMDTTENEATLENEKVGNVPETSVGVTYNDMATEKENDSEKGTIENRDTLENENAINVPGTIVGVPNNSRSAGNETDNMPKSGCTAIQTFDENQDNPLVESSDNVAIEQELIPDEGINQEPGSVKHGEMDKNKCQSVEDKAINTDITSDQDIFKIPTTPPKLAKKVKSPKATRNNGHTQNGELPQNSTARSLANFVDKIPVNKDCVDTQNNRQVTYRCSVCETSPVFVNMAALLAHTLQEHTRKRVLVHCHRCQCDFSYCEKVVCNHRAGKCKKVKLATKE